jgi:hypothetical protein
MVVSWCSRMKQDRRLICQPRIFMKHASCNTITTPYRRGHEQRRPVLFLYRFGRQGITITILHHACLGQPGECGYQSEWYMWETTYRRVGIYIHEAGTRVLTYDIDRLDEISLIGALSRRACRETHTSQIDSGLTPPVLPLLPLVSCRHGRTQR